MRHFGFLLLPCFSIAAFAQITTAQLTTAQLTTTNPDEPITATERLTWFAESTFGPTTLTAGLVSAGFGTWTNKPKEYGTHWDGFGDRYGIRLTGIATGNAMEAGLGAIWGEDPRYYRAGSDQHFGKRIGHAVKWTFVAANSDGSVRPAYARYIGVAGNNFLSNAWREPSEANNTHALERTGLGFLSKMAGNTFDEFWPDVKQKMFHKR